MTLNIAMLIKANAAQAKAELASVTDRTKLFGTQTRNTANDARQAATAMAAYEARIAAMEAELQKLIATQGKTKPAFDSGAQSVGNMVAQLNDIGVMLAAGQNPLQMAIQQGTQITQSFGDKGAAGALNMVKQGFVQMVSPVNLATIGIIAFGGAAVQWLMSSGEAAATLEDRLAALEESVTRLNEITKVYSADGVQELIEKYGVIDASLLRLIERQNQFAQNQAMQDARTAVTALTGEYGGLLSMIEAGGRGGQAAQIQLQNELGLTAQQGIALRNAMEEARTASNFTDQAAALGRMNDILAQSKIATSELAGAGNTAEAAIRQLANSAPKANWMNAAITGVNGLIGRLMTAIGVNRQLAGERRAAQGTTSALSQQYAQYGAGRASAEGMIGAGSGGATDSRAKWMQDNGFGGTAGDSGTSGGGGGGGGRAARAERDAVAELIAKLREEREVLAELDPVKQQMLRYREQLSTATAAERAEVEALIMMREREKAMDQLGEFGANSVVDLLKTIRREGESASDVFKKIINNLIDMGIQALIVGKGPLANLFGISGNIFQGGGRGGGGLGALLGALFGGGGTGTLGLPAFADGVIFGPGGGRDDKILARVSAGESIINARATARHRPLLERINAGLPRFANGMIGGAAVAAGGAGGAPVLNQTINIIGATGNSEIAEHVQRGVEVGIAEFSRVFLPDRVAEINADPFRRNF